MRNNKRHTSLMEKGITLVALIITIIVLLILAGVSLNMAFGDKGVIDRAKETSELQRRAEIEERLNTAVAAAAVRGNGILTENNLKNALDKEFKNEGYSIDDNDNEEWLITIEDLVFSVSKKGKVKFLYFARNNEDDPNIGQIGDAGNTGARVYMNLNIPTNLGITDISLDIDGLPGKKTQQELSSYIPIYTAEQFKKIASEETNYQIKDLNGNTIGSYTMAKNAQYALINDIDFSGVSDMKPIKGFEGELEGNGCTLKGISIDVKGEKTYTNIVTGETDRPNPSGVFEYVKSASIKNLAIIDSSFSSSESGGGIAGQINDTEISNCYVKDCTLNTGSSSGGIVGFVGNNGGKINSCKVINISTTNNNYFGGICGGSIGEIEILSCKVVSSSKNKTYNSGILYYAGCNKVKIVNSSIQGFTTSDGGIIGTNVTNSSDSKIEITRCTVNDVASIGASILGYSNSNTVNISDCKVKKITFNTNYNSWGIGIIQRVYSGKNLSITNCNIDEVNIQGMSDFSGIVDCVNDHNSNTTISNCTVNKIRADRIESGFSSSSSSYDSFAGVARIIEGKYNINNCRINDVSISKNANYHSVAGIIGMEKDNSTISNCYVNDWIMKGKINQFGGITRNGDKGNISNCYFTNSKIDGSSASTNSDTYYGGIQGYGYNTTINNCMVSNVELINNAYIVGGIIGVGSSKIDKCNVSNITLQCNNSYNGTGGISGFLSGSNSSQITNNNVVNITIDVKAGRTGGITSAADAGVLINNCNVLNTIINNQSSAGQYVYSGGICGLGASVSECLVQDSEITGTNIDGVGGIIGQSVDLSNATKLINSCTVRKCSIKGRNRVGGISGAASKNIFNCNVIASKITGSESEIGGIQGHGGELTTSNDTNYVVIENCGVSNSRITGKGNLGYIQGKNTYLKTDSNVPSNDKMINCNISGTEKYISR